MSRPMLSNKGPLFERFLQRFEIDESGCWIWTGCRDMAGYGLISHQRAHRVSVMLLRGVNPIGKLVLHSCDVPACVNPDHLRVGTHADNMRDMVVRNRNHRSCMLTSAQVAEIRSSSESELEISARFRVDRSTVGNIRRGETWQHYHPGAVIRRSPGGAKGRNQNASKTHCIRGHQFDGVRGGRRFCKTCSRLRKQSSAAPGISRN